MEKIAKKLAHNISLSLGFDDEKEAVVAYGLIAIIQITVIVLLVLFFGILISAPVEGLIVCFSASILRKYSGGAHANTAELCASISVIYCTLTALLSKKLFAVIYSPFAMAIALIIIFVISYVVVNKFAPVDSPNKPIRTEKKKRRMRKNSFIILSAYFVISVIFFILSYQYVVFKSYGISILFGISWQILTLTYLGGQFIEKMNDIFIPRKGVKK